MNLYIYYILFREWPCVCTTRRIWHRAGVVDISIQADGKFAIEEIPVVASRSNNYFS